MTGELLVSLSGGLPLSVARPGMALVLGPCASPGGQGRTPVGGLRLTPVGAATSEKVSVFVGMSGSVAVLVAVRLESSLMVCVGGVVSTGGRFTSLTMTVIVSAPLSGGTPLSVTRMVIEFVLGPWVSLGVQEKTPVMELMVAPAGAPGSSEKVNVLAGMSASLAVTVKVSSVPSLTVGSLTGPNTGAVLTALTVMLRVAEAL